MTSRSDEHSNYDAFMAHLEKEKTRDFGDVEAYQREVKYWTIQLTDSVGSAGFSLDCEDELMTRNGEVGFNFDITLGPVNARKLIAFLRALPPEPDDDELPDNQEPR
jgi:hypothetical protein